MAFKMKAVFLAAGVSMVATPLAATYAAAQSRDTYDTRGDPRDGYDAQDQRGGQYDGQYDDRGDGYQDPRDSRGGPQGAYDDRYYDESYDRAPPPGYDGTQAPPPPRGWRADGDDARYTADDDRYALSAEGWAQANCVRSQNNAGVGAVVGGVIGALVGNGLSNRRDRTGGTIAGAAVGAVGGAVVGGASSNATSPGCPPGYVVRRGAAGFAYAPAYGYAAPGWYRPWVFASNRWVYRPYPYHRFYARYYARPFGGRRPGFRHPRRHW